MNSLRRSTKNKKSSLSPKTSMSSKKPKDQSQSSSSEDDGLVDLRQPFRIRYVRKISKKDPTKILNYRIVEPITENETETELKNEAQQKQMKRLKAELIKQQRMKKENDRKIKRGQRKRKQKEQKHNTLKQQETQSDSSKDQSESSSQQQPSKQCIVIGSSSSEETRQQSKTNKKMTTEKSSNKIENPSIQSHSKNSFCKIPQQSIASYQAAQSSGMSGMDCDSMFKSTIVKQNPLKIWNRTTKNHKFGDQMNELKIKYHCFSYGFEIEILSKENTEPHVYSIGEQSSDRDKNIRKNVHKNEDIDEKCEQGNKNQPELDLRSVQQNEQEMSFKLHSDIFFANTPQNSFSENAPIEKLEIFGSSPLQSKAYTEPYQSSKSNSCNHDKKEDIEKQESEIRPQPQNSIPERPQLFDGFVGDQINCFESTIKHDKIIIEEKKETDLKQSFEQEQNGGNLAYSPIESLEDLHFSDHFNLDELPLDTPSTTNFQNKIIQENLHINQQHMPLSQEDLLNQINTEANQMDHNHSQMENNQPSMDLSNEELIAIEMEENGSQEGQLVIVQSRCTLKPGQFFSYPNSNSKEEKEEESEESDDNDNDEIHPEQTNNSTPAQSQKIPDQIISSSNQSHYTEKIMNNSYAFSQKSQGEMSLDGQFLNPVDPMTNQVIEPPNDEEDIVFCTIVNTSSDQMSLAQKRYYQFQLDLLEKRIAMLQSKSIHITSNPFQQIKELPKNSIQKSSQSTLPKNCPEIIQSQSQKQRNEEDTLLALFDSLQSIQQSEKERKSILIKNLEVIDHDEMINTKVMNPNFWFGGPILYDPEKYCQQICKFI